MFYRVDEELESSLRSYELENCRLETELQVFSFYKIKLNEIKNELINSQDQINKISSLIEERDEMIQSNEIQINENNIEIEKIKCKINETRTMNISDLINIKLPNGVFSETMSESSTKAERSFPAVIYEWPEFKINLNKFDKNISALVKTRFEPYKFLDSVEFYSHDDVWFLVMTICNEIFTRRLLAENERPYFHAWKNSQYVYGDIFFKDQFLIEIKTPKVLNIIKDYNERKGKAYKAVRQTFDYMKSGNICFAMLSTFEKSWCLFRHNDTLFISPELSMKKLIISIYYILSLRDNTINQTSIIDHKNSIKKFNQRMNIKDYSQEIGNDCDETDEFEIGVGIEINDKTSEEIMDLILASLYKSVYLGSGFSGAVFKVLILNKYYALKSNNLNKSTPEQQEEMFNEIKILKFLNSKHLNFVPNIYFGGEIGSRLCILMSYIDGKFIEFEKMNKEQKKSCIECLGDLHKQLCLHGDLREENFIFKGDQAFVVDFGRSQILNDSQESQNKFKLEMDELLNELGSIDE